MKDRSEISGMTPFYKFITIIGRPIIKLITHYKTIGLDHIPESGGLILCCNHTSMLDIAILVLTNKRRIYFMAKEELFHVPVAGWFFRMMGGFPVARGAGDTAAIDKAKAIVQRGDILGIFPEGTRTKDPAGHPGKGKSGVALIAAQTGGDVLPATIRYKNYHGKVPYFTTKALISYGKPISTAELAFADDSRAEIKRVAGRIMDEITKSWEGLQP